jgi:hypothetical protein
MRRKLKNLKHKSGHSENGAPRAIIDLQVYREYRNANITALHAGQSPHWGAQFSGLSHAARPKDFPIFVRPILPEGA